MAFRTVLFAVVALFLFSCSLRHPVRIETSETDGWKPVVELSGSRGEDDGGLIESGIASWYGVDFHGKATADGEIYDMNRLTAAHQTLPFHTLVEVENLENRKKTVVRINDRGPFLKNRIIDLSFKAARRVGIEETGTAPVRLRIIARGTGAGSAPMRQGGRFCLQVGAFESIENARDLIARLRVNAPEIRVAVVAEDNLFKVICGPFPSQEKSEEAKVKLEALRFNCFPRECSSP